MGTRLFKLLKNRYFLSVLLAIPYGLYIGFIVHNDKGPIDYETFMSIGQRFLNSEPIYTVNSYYPMPFVMIFAFFASLPRFISMIIWLVLPVICAWLISGKNPLILIFAPVLGHFVGGQASIFGMLGLWGFRKNRQFNSTLAGSYLALTLLKPQLGIVPTFIAMLEWITIFKKTRMIPLQVWGLLTTLGIFYIPGFLIDPFWVTKWLNSPRPLFERALSAFIPRTLLLLFGRGSLWFWGCLIGTILLSLVLLIKKFRTKVSLDLIVIWSFIISPFVHDYDLIQLVPLLDSSKKLVLSVLLSLPGLFVIFFAYTIDQAWFVFSIIAPGLLIYILSKNKKAITSQNSMTQ